MAEMDDDEYEILPPPKKTPAPEPPKPLPRLWKTEQEAAEAERAKLPAEPAPPSGKGKAPTSKPAGSREPRAAAGAGAAGPAQGASPPKAALSRRERERLEAEQPPVRKGALIEETPEFDTYEARQRVRMLIGGTVGLVVVVGLLLIIVPRLNTGEETFENLPDEGAITAPTVAAGPKDSAIDLEARNMFENARVLAKNGKTNDAIAMLKKVISSYPKTLTAQAAKDALERPTKQPPLPLFLDESKSTVVVTSSEPGGGSTHTIEVPSAPSLTAVDTVPPKNGKTVSGDASLHLPANPDEPGAANAPGGASGAAPSNVTAKPIPPGFHVKTEAGLHKSGWPLMIASDRDGSPMMFIPPGTFRMGRDDGGPEEGPAHFVNLGAYYIDQHEVTVRQYNLFLKETSGKSVTASSLKKDGVTTEFSSDHPIVLVTAKDAVAFCEWAGKRLPTEAQWEKAARTTDGRPFPWGGSEPTWLRPRQSKQIDRVMSYELDQSPYGVYDLAGNAWEWTADYFDPGYYKQFRDTPATNPLGPAPKGRSPQLVLKGGSKTWQATWREGLKPETKYPFVGFRGVLMVDDAGSPAAPASPSGQPGPQPRDPNRRNAPASSGGIVPF